LSAAVLLPSLGTSAANVALPTLAQGFAAPMARVQWVVIAYLLAMTALVVAAGRLGDRLGRRRLLLAGMATFALASAAGAMAPGLPLLIGARAVQGAGAALLLALAVALVGDVVPAGRTGRAVGLLGTVSAVGTALGPSLGGLLLAAAGWRALFAAMALAGLAALALAALALPRDSAPPRRDRLDLAGMALLAAALGSFALAFTPGAAPRGTSLALLALAAAALAAFVGFQRHAAMPLLRLDRLTRPGALLAMALVSAIVMATLVVGPFWLTEGLGLSPAATGLAMSVGPAVAALTGVPSGRLVDRYGPAMPARAGLAASLAGCLSLAALAPRLGLSAFAASLALTTFGYALFQAANTSAVMRAAPEAERGIASALLGLARNLGLIAGASAMASAYGAGARGVPLLGLAATPASGLALTFALAALLAALALAATAARAPRRRLSPTCPSPPSTPPTPGRRPGAAGSSGAATRRRAASPSRNPPSHAPCAPVRPPSRPAPPARRRRRRRRRR
jgi:MFS family permease